MNNDLEQFSEERLIELREWVEVFGRHPRLEECEILVRIALAAKQAKPVGYLFVSPDGGIAYSISNVEFEGVKLVGPIYSTPQPAHTEQAIPDGWKLVPGEPTYEMKKHYYDSSVAPISKLSVTGYRAMLAAAPKPESE